MTRENITQFFRVHAHALKSYSYLAAQISTAISTTIASYNRDGEDDNLTLASNVATAISTVALASYSIFDALNKREEALELDRNRVAEYPNAVRNNTIAQVTSEAILIPSLLLNDIPKKIRVSLVGISFVIETLSHVASKSVAARGLLDGGQVARNLQDAEREISISRESLLKFQKTLPNTLQKAINDKEAEITERIKRELEIKQDRNSNIDDSINNIKSMIAHLNKNLKDINEKFDSQTAGIRSRRSDLEGLLKSLLGKEQADFLLQDGLEAKGQNQTPGELSQSVIDKINEGISGLIEIIPEEQRKGDLRSSLRDLIIYLGEQNRNIDLLKESLQEIFNQLSQNQEHKKPEALDVENVEVKMVDDYENLSSEINKRVTDLIKNNKRLEEDNLRKEQEIDSLKKELESLRLEKVDDQFQLTPNAEISDMSVVPLSKSRSIDDVERGR